MKDELIIIEDMENLPHRCPVCGGQIVKDYFGTYCRSHKVNKDGSLSKRYKNVLYETSSEDDSIVYCEECKRKVVQAGREEG